MSATIPSFGQTRTGADRILEKPYVEWLQGRRVGLVTNQTGVNRRLESTASLLGGVPGLRLVALFAPEHGLEGSLQAGESVAGSARVFSLYGETREPTREMLANLDLLVYDIQDVGARYYSYLSTLLGILKAAAQAGLPVVLLDRPDPIGGAVVEGPTLTPELASSVGIPGLPIRYGMTPGELARYLNRELALGCDLKVVPLQGWRRAEWFDHTGIPWVLPSPNMPTLETAVVYPGFCLIEGTNLSEGRGTTKPFELFGSPWLNHTELAKRLNRLALPGVIFRPQSFTPTFSKYQGQACRGLQVHVLDRDRFQPIQTALRVLEEVIRLHPKEFRLEAGFDRLAGDPSIRRALENRESPTGDSWRSSLREFQRKRRIALLYH